MDFVFPSEVGSSKSAFGSDLRKTTSKTKFHCLNLSESLNPCVSEKQRPSEYTRMVILTHFEDVSFAYCLESRISSNILVCQKLTVDIVPHSLALTISFLDSCSKQLVSTSQTGGSSKIKGLDGLDVCRHSAQE